MQHLESSDTPVLYIGRTVLKGEMCSCWIDHRLISNLKLM